MSNFSILTIAGRLVRDPETKTVGEHTVTEVTIAYDTGFAEKKKPVFLKTKAWNKTGVALARLGKGDPVLLNGTLEMSQWEKDGQKRSEHLMNVNSVTYISAKREATAETERPAADRPAPRTPPAHAPLTDEEVPF